MRQLLNTHFQFERKYFTVIYESWKCLQYVLVFLLLKIKYFSRINEIHFSDIADTCTDIQKMNTAQQMKHEPNKM